jgi:hypothetical protein
MPSNPARRRGRLRASVGRRAGSWPISTHSFCRAITSVVWPHNRGSLILERARGGDEPGGIEPRATHEH